MPEGSQLCQEAKTKLDLERSMEDVIRRGGATAAHAQNNIHHKEQKTVSAMGDISNTMLNTYLRLIHNSQDKVVLTFGPTLL